MKKLLLVICVFLCITIIALACIHAYAWCCLRRSDFPAYSEDDIVRKQAYLNRALRCEPDNPQIYYAIGKMYDEIKRDPFLAGHVPAMPKEDKEIRKKCLSLSIAYYRKAKDLDPNNALYHYRLGRAYLEIPLEENEFAGEEASREFEEAINLDRNNPLYHFWMGVYYQTSGSLKGAISKYREAIGRDRAYAARVLKAAWEIDHYAPCLQEIAKGHEYLQTLLPGILVESNELVAARAACISACQKADKYSLDNQIELLRRLIQLNEPALAKLYALEWLERRPVVPLELMLVSALELGGEHALALQRMEDVTKRNAASAMCHARLADLYRNANRFDEAVKEYEEAIKLEPTNADHYETLARTYWKQKDFASASRVYGRLVEACPDEAYAHYRLGNARMAMSDVEGAIAAFREAVSLAPNDKRFKRALAAALARKKQIEKGLREQDKRNGEIPGK